MQTLPMPRALSSCMGRTADFASTNVRTELDPLTQNSAVLRIQPIQFSWQKWILIHPMLLLHRSPELRDVMPWHGMTSAECFRCVMAVRALHQQMSLCARQLKQIVRPQNGIPPILGRCIGILRAPPRTTTLNESECHSLDQAVQFFETKEKQR